MKGFSMIRILELTRNDLRGGLEHIPFDDLDVIDFKIKMHDIEISDVIIFKEDEQKYKYFKDRFNRR